MKQSADFVAVRAPILPVELVHRTRYHYSEPVLLSPQDIRLAPAPRCRAPIRQYTLKVEGGDRAHWYQDVYGSCVARVSFPQRMSVLDIRVRLVADLAPINPFAFLVADHAAVFPLGYEDDERLALTPYLQTGLVDPRFQAWLTEDDAKLTVRGAGTVDVLVGLTERVAREVQYERRMEPGVQPVEQTLELRRGSCRDSTWLLVQALRHHGVAARYVSGYLVQEKSQGSAAVRYTLDLHAWAEAYLPGAGWIGLDPTSGLLTAEAHIALAYGTSPEMTAPVQGTVGVAQSTMSVEMYAKPYAEDDQ